MYSYVENFGATVALLGMLREAKAGLYSLKQGQAKLSNQYFNRVVDFLELHA